MFYLWLKEQAYCNAKTYPFQFPTPRRCATPWWHPADVVQRCYRHYPFYWSTFCQETLNYWYGIWPLLQVRTPHFTDVDTLLYLSNETDVEILQNLFLWVPLTYLFTFTFVHLILFPHMIIIQLPLHAASFCAQYSKATFCQSSILIIGFAHAARYIFLRFFFSLSFFFNLLHAFCFYSILCFIVRNSRFGSVFNFIPHCRQVEEKWKWMPHCLRIMIMEIEICNRIWYVN